MALDFFEDCLNEDDIYAVENFFKNGRFIKRLVGTESGLAFFIGEGKVQQIMSLPNGQQTAQVMELEFPIEAETIEEAYSKFQESLESFVEEKKKAMEESNSIVQAPASALGAIDRSRIVRP